MADNKTLINKQAASLSVIELEALRDQWRGHTRNMAFFSVVQTHNLQSGTMEFDGFNWLRVKRGNWDKIESDFANSGYMAPKRRMLLAWMLEPSNRLYLNELFVQKECLLTLFDENAFFTEH